MTTLSPINLAGKLSALSEYWSPRVVAEMNDYQFKVVKLKGEFVWHRHDDTDETFLVLAGEFASFTMPLPSAQPAKRG